MANQRARAPASSISRTLRFELPKSAEPGLGELSVNVAPGVLASMSGSLDALIDYPHGCVEQTTSRLIPMVLLENILRHSGDTRLSGKEHHAKMEAAVRHVLNHQNADGGFGLWPSSPSEGFLTAYALWGLLTARDHGYAVPASSVTAGLAYLARNTTEGGDMHGQFAQQDTPPFAAFVLAAAKQADGGLTKKLLQEQGTLSRFGIGLLGAALAQRPRASQRRLAARAVTRSGEVARRHAGRRAQRQGARSVRLRARLAQHCGDGARARALRARRRGRSAGRRHSGPAWPRRLLGHDLQQPVGAARHL
ncbi:MAG: hypothetical protein QM756_08710 [Polyangiaceae bacterium]